MPPISWKETGVHVALLGVAVFAVAVLGFGAYFYARVAFGL